MSEVDKNRINRVVDYIQANLDTSLSIRRLSEIACYSEFHFNRVFKKDMGEPVHKFVRRLRIEKSADFLLTKPQTSITEIALMCGFATPSSFAKSFKNYFKMSATEWRKNSDNIFDTSSEPVQVEQGKISITNGSPVWTFDKKGSIRQVVIENIPQFKVAYVRNVGPYQQDDTLFDKLYAQLFRWAVPRGYMNDGTITLNIYHDNPEITENHKLRVMAAIPVEEHATPSGAVGVTSLSGGKYGACRFLLNKDNFAEAWGWMMSNWLNNSGYEKDDREAFERCYGTKIVNGTRLFDVGICVPIKAK